MSKRFTLFSIGGVALVGALALAGCASQTANIPPATTVATEAPAAAAAAAPDAQQVDPTVTDPQAAAAAASAPPKAPSGMKDTKVLVVKDTTVGKGATVKSGDKVTVNYTGWLTSGSQFDSSVGRAPFSFTVGGGQVIQGWDKGLVGMKVGGTRQLTIPGDMGYGAQGQGPIPPGATLVFKIDLLSIDK